MTLDLTQLAQQAASIVVAAAASDFWPRAKESFARVLGRRNSGRIKQLEIRLDALRAELSSINGDENQRRVIEANWRGRFEVFLEDHSDAAPELQQIVQQLQDLSGAHEASVIRISNIKARDSAVQLIVGKGQIGDVSLGTRST